MFCESKLIEPPPNGIYLVTEDPLKMLLSCRAVQRFTAVYGRTSQETWETFCLATGITHERARAYTPQQNGLAERMNRLDLVRSTMTGCTLLHATWAELIYTTAYIRNSVTNKHNEVKTPYELWFNRKPSLRLSELAVAKCMFTSQLRRGSPSLTPEHTKRIVQSRDCTFLENKNGPHASLNMSNSEVVFKGGDSSADTVPSADEGDKKEPEPCFPKEGQEQEQHRSLSQE
ncbi:hypothetical protein M514_19633 [Trichuris suis]|uniref:Integrase catalytic domain-containing protein n=1 Tax=Trichuris suis TaxID=68888 RepID=A0A085NFA5_9BILA|nr:hypothetical protein M514_19633 [Trichuris suis]